MGKNGNPGLTFQIFKNWTSYITNFLVVDRKKDKEGEYTVLHNFIKI